MPSTQMFDHQWPYILSFLPRDIDLEESAKATGALTRRRGITSADDLLRLAMVYGFCGFSLRQTAAWAQAAGVAELSDVAVLKRLRKAAPWLGHLLGVTLARRGLVRFGQQSQLRARLVDATTISRPGSKGTNWRVHLGFDLRTLTMDEVQVTDVKGGETLKRFTARAQEVLVGDRGYAHRAGLDSVHKAGGFFLVRIPWQTVPLQDLSGKPLALIELLRDIPDAQVLDQEVFIAANPKAQSSQLRVRLVAVRKTEAAAEQDRLNIRKNRSKKQKTADPRTLEAAGYTFVITSLPQEMMNGQQVLELYRFRWQIEVAFKRMKSLLRLDALLAKDQALAQTFLYSKLLAALLLEDLMLRFLEFSPWGYRL